MEERNDVSGKSKRIIDKKEWKRLKSFLYRFIQLGVNLRQDWVFHIMFGRVQSALFLLALINAVFRNAGEPTVKSIKFRFRTTLFDIIVI